MLIDSSKYGKEFPYSFCQLADINLLITDSDKSKYMPEAELSGVTVISTGISKSIIHFSYEVCYKGLKYLSAVRLVTILFLHNYFLFCKKF